MLAQFADLGPDTGPNFKANLEGVIRPHIARCRPPRYTVVEAKRASLSSFGFWREGGAEVGLVATGVWTESGWRCGVEFRNMRHHFINGVASSPEQGEQRNKLTSQDNNSSMHKQELPKFSRKGLSSQTTAAVSANKHSKLTKSASIMAKDYSWKTRNSQCHLVRLLICEPVYDFIFHMHITGSKTHSSSHSGP